MARSIKETCPDLPKGITSCQKKKLIVEVITTLFGGGVEAGYNDRITLIRSSSIHGHLRFWWRATRGASFESVAELRQREGEIWGTTENPSPVGIAVKVEKQTAFTPCVRYEWDSGKRQGAGGYKLKWCQLFDPHQTSLPYALFPFQGSAPDSNEPKDPAKYVGSATFSLELSIPTEERMARLRADYNKQRSKVTLPELTERDDDIQPDVEAAIWAWVNFGGIGARTRRGCGALFCRDFAPFSVADIGAWFESHRKKYGLAGTILTNQWPMLTRAPFILNRTGTALEAWSESVGLMRDFRQCPTGRDVRSLWPEADSLRAITGRGKWEHQGSITLPQPIDPESDAAFPRAELGLPIVFHFKDAADSPNDCQLYPKGSKRMASPVILRPLAFGDGKRAVPMVLQLTGPKPQELELDGLEDPPALTSHHIRRSDLGEYARSPLKRSAQGSALDAFIAFAGERGFNEVKP